MRDSLYKQAACNILDNIDRQGHRQTSCLSSISLLSPSQPTNSRLSTFCLHIDLHLLHICLPYPRRFLPPIARRTCRRVSHCTLPYLTVIPHRTAPNLAAAALHSNPPCELPPRSPARTADPSQPHPPPLPSKHLLERPLPYTPVRGTPRPRSHGHPFATRLETEGEQDREREERRERERK